MQNLPEALHGRRGFVVTLGLLTGTAALTVDLSLPAVPEMAKALATTLSRGQLIVGVFMAGMAAGQIPSGLLSDRVGRLPVLYSGMALFALAAAVAAAARSIDVMLAARFIQGFGAASAVVLSRAIVRDVAHGREAARLMSLITMIFTAAPVIAPSIGAVLVAELGWRAPFIAIAVCGVLLIAAVRGTLPETFRPGSNVHPVRQLRNSIREFFSYRQSVFGLLLIVLPPAGYMSIIAVSAALTVEIYGFSLKQYGLLFACAGLSILAGSVVNRLLVARFDQVELIVAGVALVALAGGNLLLIAWLDRAPYAWLWGAVCLYMFAIPILLSNAMVLALDPLPRIAGVASSIIGTLQNVCGAFGAMTAALLYDGSVRFSVLILGFAALATTAVFACRPLIAPGPIVRHPDELARD